MTHIADHLVCSRRFSVLSMAVFALFALFLVMPLQASAKGDGENLEKALKSGKKTINFSGKEGSDITIPKNVTVLGKSLSQAVINGDITMRDGAILKNVTVNARIIGITVDKGASVTLDNVTVKGAKETGIFTKEGGGILTVRNSRISQNRKGFYILPGKTLAFVNNEVSKNKEEGIDIRKGVGGVITGNRITQNGEGGIEVITGDSSLAIRSNTFVSNKASGLALQFYDDARGLGRIRVESNTFAENGNFGVLCNNPSGGKFSVNFFRSSVTLSENILRSNGKGSIHPVCQLTNVFPQVVEDTSEAEVALSAEQEADLQKIEEAVVVLERDIMLSTDFFGRWGYYLLDFHTKRFYTFQVRLDELRKELALFKESLETDTSLQIQKPVLERIIVLEDMLESLSLSSFLPKGRYPLGSDSI